MIGVTTGALVAAVWQGALLAAVVWVALRMLPKTPAAVRFAIWFGVFVVVTAMPLVSLWPHAAKTTQAGGRGAWLTLDMRWSLAIAAVWGAASLVRAVKLVVAAVRVRGLWKRAVPVAGAGSVAPADSVKGETPWSTASDMGHPTRRAELCVSDEVDRPTVIGFFAPKILIPTWLLEKLTPAELEQVVLHEAGHLGRADDWMNLLQKIALVIFPLNPALAWVERRLCFERELAVDERVLHALAGRAGAATAYASCLATVAEHRLGRRGFALALGALGRESELGRRVGRILRRGEVMRPVQARLVLGGALMGLLGVSAGLERCPELVGFAANAPAVERADIVNLNNYMRSNYLKGTRNVAHEVLTSASVYSGGRGEGGPQRLKPRTALALYGTAEAVPLTKTMADQARGAAEAAPSMKPREVGDGAAESAVASNASGRRFAGKAGMVRRTDLAQRDSAEGDRLVAVPEQGIQWMVVTEWQSVDGSERAARMVLTTAPMPDRKARARWAQRVQSDMAPVSEQDLEQVYPYAAVPVQGGWLVIQL